MTIDGLRAFHRRVAEELAARYRPRESTPEGWRETLAWHWEQAEAYAPAADVALEVAELMVTRLDFVGARRWAERALMLIERLPVADQSTHDLRASTLALAVLEFGGQYAEGLEYARRMRRAAQRHANPAAETRAEMAIGRMQRELGQLAAAETSLRRAQDLADRYDLADVESEIRLHLAKTHQLQGRHLEALQQLQLAREEHEQRDDKVQLARVLTSIGDLYRVLGSGREAFTFYTRALSLDQGRGYLVGQAMLKDKLALSLLDQNRPADALVSAEEGLRLRERLNDLVGQARSFTVLGMIARRLGKHQQSLSNFERARDLQELVQNPRGHTIALMNLGDASRSLHRLPQAEEFYDRALSIAHRETDTIGIARALERLGDLHDEQGRKEDAAARWADALRLRDDLHHADEANALRERINALHGRDPDVGVHDA